MDLSQRMKIIKEHFNLNSSQLSRMINVTSQTISNIENGTTLNPKMKVILDICNTLNINYSWLLAGKGSMLMSESNIDAKEQINRLQNELDFSRKEILAMRNINEFQKEKITRLENQLREKS